MKKSFLFIILSIAMCLSHSSIAQDIHFSNYYSFAPNLNPALVGNFDGSYRIAAIYRNQGLDYLGGSSFSTPGIAFDMPIFAGHLDRDKIAIGGMFYNDKAGKGTINNLNAALGVAYHRGLGKDSKSQISVGFQAGYINKRLDINSITLYDQFDEITWSGTKTSVDQLPNNTVHLFDFNAGIYFKSQISERFGMQIGSSVYHINEPKQSLINTTSFKLPMRMNADLGLRIKLNERWFINPDALYQQINNHSEFLFGTQAEYRIKNGFRDNSSIHFGARYRWDDAMIALFAYEFKNFTIGAAYDFNTSGLIKSSSLRGGFEVSLVYIGEDIKHYNAKKSLPCRRF